MERAGGISFLRGCLLCISAQGLGRDGSAFDRVPDEEVAFYNENGHLRNLKVLNDEQITRLRDELKT